jgi:hypothetical protein
MAETTTTLLSAVAQTDVVINVTSATGFAAASYVKVDDEVMQISKSYVSGTAIPVQRGLDGAAQVAHPITANVTVFLVSDLSGGASVQTPTQWPNIKGRRMLSYSVAGAITLPNPGEDMIAVINGTNARAMTLANPTKDMDGSMLYIIANGKAAHTVTYTAGVGNGGSTMDVGTYNATEATGCALVAMNGFWILWANGVGSTGTQVAGVVWA